MSAVAFLQIIQLKVSFGFGLVTLSSTDNLTGPLQLQYSWSQLPAALLYTVYNCTVAAPYHSHSNWFGWLLLRTVLFCQRWADIPSLVCKIIIMGGGHKGYGRQLQILQLYHGSAYRPASKKENNLHLKINVLIYNLFVSPNILA